MKLDFKEKAEPKVGSKYNIEHKAGGGTKKVSKITTFTAASHCVKIVTEKNL